MNSKSSRKRKLSKFVPFMIIIGLLVTDSVVIMYIINGSSISYNHNSKDFFNIVKYVNAIPADNIYNPGEGVFLTAYGKVVEKLAPDLSPPRHEKFVITVNNTRNVTVVYNIDYQGRGWLNVEVGDWIVFTGEVFLFGNNKYGIHKIAEDGGFLILFRPSSGMLLKIGYYPPSDNSVLLGLLVINLVVIVIWRFRKRLFGFYFKGQ